MSYSVADGPVLCYRSCICFPEGGEESVANFPSGDFPSSIVGEEFENGSFGPRLVIQGTHWKLAENAAVKARADFRALALAVNVKRTTTTDAAALRNDLRVRFSSDLPAKSTRPRRACG